MPMKSKLMLFIAFLTIALFCYSQTSKYVVVTFSAKRGIDKHFVNYYWITPVDSIKGMNFCLYPLYLAEYSSDNVYDCKKGDSINIFTHTVKTAYDFEDGYEQGIEELISLIDGNRTKIQSIKTKWTNKAYIDINVYVTPISGDFCRCFYYKDHRDKFEAWIYLPVKDFSFEKAFWSISAANFVKYANYSHVEYNSHLLHERYVQESLK